MLTCTHIKSSSYCKICEVKPEKKKRKRIPQMSEKMKADNKKYLKARTNFLSLNLVCQFEKCTNKATQVHHRKGRIGSLLINENYFMAVCSTCHQIIEENPEYAKEKGYSVSRLN